MIYCDSHIHLPLCNESYPDPSLSEDQFYSCVCALTTFEYCSAFNLYKTSPLNVHIMLSFGIHPQNPVIEHYEFLKGLLRNKDIQAVGECGYDFFTPEYKALEKDQIECFNAQVELCIKFEVPLIVHVRKAMDYIFRDSKKLSRIPSVIFHSYPGSIMDYKSLCKKGVNCYFSFGKSIISGKKSALQCCHDLPLDRILLETDGPYQTLKGENETKPLDIKNVYSEFCKIRNISGEKLSPLIFNNYKTIFGL